MKSIFLVTCLLIAASQAIPQRNTNEGLLANSVNDFSQRLYQQIAVIEDNVVFSAFSIHMSLTMTLLGARNETADEMSEVLGLNGFLDNSGPHQAYKEVNTQINSVPGVEVYTANAIFVHPTTELQSQFISEASEYYTATVDNFDPTAIGGPEKEINDFVEDNTNNQIVDLLPSGTINEDTRAVIVNTVYFNTTWQEQFSEDQTQPREFLTGNETIQVPMMFDERTVDIKRSIYGADVARLPFINERFSLYIAVPRDVNGIVALEDTLANQGAVDDLFTGLEPTRVNLYIPKFRVESSFVLKAPLQEMGILKAFDPLEADFQGISNSSKVFVSETIHKSVIEVTEKGTTAAAATATLISTTSVQEPPQEDFKADRPFLFFLRNDDLGLLLFSGKFSG